MSIEGQGHFFTIYFPGFVCFFCFTRPRYEVSVYRTIGPLVYITDRSKPVLMMCLSVFACFDVSFCTDSTFYVSTYYAVRFR